MNDEDLRLLERAAREDPLAMWDYLRANARAARRLPADLLEDEWARFAWFEACEEAGLAPPELSTDAWKAAARVAMHEDPEDPEEHGGAVECLSHGRPSRLPFRWPDDIALTIIASVTRKHAGNLEYSFGGRLKDGRYVEFYAEEPTLPDKRGWQRGWSSALNFYACPRKFMWSAGHVTGMEIIGLQPHPWAKGLTVEDLACSPGEPVIGLASAPEWYRLGRREHLT